jgi:hypothetical protein
VDLEALLLIIIFSNHELGTLGHFALQTIREYVMFLDEKGYQDFIKKLPVKLRPFLL